MSTHPPPDPATAAPASARARPAAGFAVCSLLCAVVGLALLTHPFAELAILFGVLARRRLPQHPPRRGGATALWGIALGALALVLFVVLPLALDMPR